MFTSSAEVVIDRPPDEVFAFIADARNRPQWDRSVDGEDLTSPEPVGVGSTVRTTMTSMGRELEWSWRITDHQPPARQRIESTDGPFPMSLAWDLEPAGAGTRARFAISDQPGVGHAPDAAADRPQHSAEPGRRLPSAEAAARVALGGRGFGDPALRQRQAAARLAEEHLHVSDAPLAEATLAHRQPQRPEAAEGLVVAEGGGEVGVGDEALAPVAKRLGVVLGDVVHPDGRHVGDLGDAALDHLDRGQPAAGEDEGVGEALRRLLHLIDAVVADNRLQEEEPVVGQQLGAMAEVGVEVLPADRLDHLKRDE